MEKIKTFGELKEHLLAVMDYANNNPCKKNPRITKERFWNICLSACMEESDGKKCNDILVKNVLTEFPTYLTENKQ